jgi:asparagine synthase (glutamine-hydrolysing)
MCGFFAGIFEPDIAPSDDAIACALASLKHRGPDGHDFRRFTLADGRIAVIGHTRLALVGLESGRQPFDSPDHATVVNGEFYDWHDRRREMQALGARFVTQSDSEIAHAAFGLHGPDGWLAALDGEWAAAVIDKRTSSLHVACDPFGTKPLRHWQSQNGRSCAVASEAKALFALGVPAALDLQALRLALTFQYLPLGRTLFAGVGMLAPGHRIDFVSGHATPQPWSNLALGQSDGRAGSDPVDIMASLRNAVTRRLPTERSFATHLSGGLDSALILALASETAGPGVEAFVADFDFGQNETDQARQTAQFIGATLVPVRMTARELVEASSKAAHHAEGMCMNAHAAAKIMIARAVRENGHACVLTGEGADEAFWGYEHLRLDAGVPFPDQLLGQTAGIHRPAGDVCNLDSLAEALGGSVPAFLKTKVGMTAPIQAALGEAFPSRPFAHADLASHLPVTWLAQMRGMTSDRRARALWNVHALSGYILRGLDDAMGMSHGVESRLSFLDRNVQQLAARTNPVGHFTNSRLEKRLLREGSRGLVPEAVRQRPKAPFLSPLLTGTPEGRVWARERILEGRLISSGILDRAAAETLFAMPLTPALDANLMMLSSLGEMVEGFAV